MANRVKITVIKKSLQVDLMEKYNMQQVKLCDQFEIGDEFICENTNHLPLNFCAWAFADIAREISLVAYDLTRKTTKVSCCTSGFHNVYFYIEPD